LLLETSSLILGFFCLFVGVAAGNKYGVAKDAKLFSVKVLGADGGGTTNGLIEGIDHVIQKKLSQGNSAPPTWVVNISIGTKFSVALNSAIDRLVDAGCVVAVAAGNQATDACQKSPSSAGRAITVAATTKQDARSDYSNYGSCVDIFAPGSSITSADSGSDSATDITSGTSAAAPHVAGVAAMYLERDPTMSPEEVWNAMHDDCAVGKVSNVNGSPNLLLSTMGLMDTAGACGRFFDKCKGSGQCCYGRCSLLSGRCALV
jgi:subtilisin family serine protease